MAGGAKKRAAKRVPRPKHSAGPNGDVGGLRLKRDTDIMLGDTLRAPTSDVVMLDDDGWIEDAT